MAWALRETAATTAAKGDASTGVTSDVRKAGATEVEPTGEVEAAGVAEAGQVAATAEAEVEVEVDADRAAASPADR